MTGRFRARPLLLLDVDGPLNPYRLLTRRGHVEPKLRAGESRFTYLVHELEPTDWIGTEKCRGLVSPDHGRALIELTEVFTLVWASTWEESANELLSPLLGLPELPVIEWPDRAREWALVDRHQGSWKSKHIAAWLTRYADGSPWVWVDDEITRADREWFHRHYGDSRGALVPPRWLLTIDPRHGLREFDFQELHAWGAAHRG